MGKKVVWPELEDRRTQNPQFRSHSPSSSPSSPRTQWRRKSRGMAALITLFLVIFGGTVAVFSGVKVGSVAHTAHSLSAAGASEEARELLAQVASGHWSSTGRVEGMRRQLLDLTSRLENMGEQHVRDMQKRLIALALPNITSKHDTTREELASCQQRLEADLASCEARSAQCEEGREERDKAVKVLKKEKLTIENQLQQARIHRQNLESQTKQCFKLKNDNSKLKAKNSKLSDENKKLQKKLQEMQKSKELASTREKELEAELEAARRERDQLQQDKELLGKDKKQLGEDKTRLEEALMKAKADASCEAQEKDAAAARAAKSKLEQEKAKLEVEGIMLEEELSRAKKELARVKIIHPGHHHGSIKLEVPTEKESSPSPIHSLTLTDIERLRVENLKLKEAVERLNVTTEPCKPAVQQTVVSAASGDVAQLRKLLKSLQDRMDLSSTPSDSLFDTSSEGMRRAAEAAKKVLEQCGVRQGLTQLSASSRLYSCSATEDELKQYLSYTPREPCPDDWHFVQRLIFVKGCYCLPRRRCFARIPDNFTEPSVAFPESLFEQQVLISRNVRWSKRSWKSYEELNSRSTGDCKNCFNMTLQSNRWHSKYKGTIAIDQMLSLKGSGAFKIGLDVGGTTGTFAAKMARQGITIVTSAMNRDMFLSKEAGMPYMETIAQRGLIPLYAPHTVRQPFFDGTLDLVHSMNSIRHFTIPEFEELMFEWDRILRPGGVIWLELFSAPRAEMPFFISVLDLFSYKKLYWNLTPKGGKADKDDVLYLNCVLEKPSRAELIASD